MAGTAPAREAHMEMRSAALLLFLVMDPFGNIPPFAVQMAISGVRGVLAMPANL